jgi:L-ascorbate metabolism protein UlaG (beta-lactamase superfamily)
MRLTSYDHSASRIGTGAAKLLIHPFLSNNPSRNEGWIGNRESEVSTQADAR